MPVSPSPSSTADREIILSRVLDAPRELVFDAWTDPAHVAQWWGPDGYSTQVHQMEVKAGGTLRFLLTGPDGTKFPDRITYREVVRPERLVYRHGSDVDDDPEAFEVTVTFEAQGQKTRLTMHSVFPSVQECQRVKAFGAVELGQQTLAKLAAFVQRPR
ncbi:SRPBCC family protein [Stigmatella sp. ncwal1]|uniref:SRPBCC family protein n=1 Tax=Stigmatella ashevillensis TaxID=2995309 RepID=A0ABT5D6K4_9BACT|nr:SRPBCC family protein [Stigmatella ashevillena]MDC0708699.1 SRPBCC family protein [Stigmatella ashevillena]